MPPASAARVVIIGTMIAAIIAVLVVSGWLLLWPIWLEYRATPAKSVGPDRFLFGTVRVGSVVEANARISIDVANPIGLIPKVREPYFLRIAKTHVSTPEEAKDRQGPYCDVFFNVDTSRPGDFSGTVNVFVGGQRGEIPVTVTVLPREPDIPRVLVASTPFDRFSTADGSDFQPFVDAISVLKVEINYTSQLPPKISDFDIILLGLDELCQLDAQKRIQLREFVKSGGRLIVAANAFFVPTVPNANEILADYGLEIEDAEPHRKVESTLIAPDELTRTTRRVYFFRPSPIRVRDEAGAMLLVRSPFDDDAGYVAVSRHGGEVVALGQSLWWDWVSRDAKGTDNARLLQSLLSGHRKPKRMEP